MKAAEVRTYALSLPETTEAPHFKATSFRVRGKIFATVPPGEDVLHVFVDEETRESALVLEPKFLEKLFWGKKVWGLRVLLAKAKPKVVEKLLEQAWQEKAPKSLAAMPAEESPRKAPTRKTAKSTTQNKTTATEASVDAYMAAIKEPTRRSDCLAIMDLMKAATKENATMWGTAIVGFGSRHYRYESGREGDICLLGFASRKETIALYLHGGLEPQAARLKKLGKHKIGKGCLYIGKLADVDAKVLLDILESLGSDTRMIRVAPLRQEDRPHWNELARGYKTFYEAVLTDADYDRTWQRIMDGGAVHGLGAHLDGRLVGITHHLFHATVWMEDACYLQDLFVDDAVRGKGIARALIAAVADAARERGASRLYWMTRQDNAIARALYDKVAMHKGFIRYDYPLE